MTDLHINDLERLEKAATPGIWEPDAGTRIRVATPKGDHDVVHAESKTRGVQDAAFVARFRNDARALIAAVKERDEMRDQIAALTARAEKAEAEARELRLERDRALVAVENGEHENDAELSVALADLADVNAKLERLAKAADPFSKIKFSFDEYGFEMAEVVLEGIRGATVTSCASHDRLSRQVDELRAALRDLNTPDQS